MIKKLSYVTTFIFAATFLGGMGWSDNLNSPAPKAIPAAPLDPIVKQSSVFIPINLSAKLIADTVEKTVPKRVSERRGISISGVSGERVDINVARAPLNTSLTESGISVSGETTSASARVRGRIRPFGPSFSQTARGRIKFKLTAKPEFKSDWKIDPKLGYNFDVPSMSTHVAGIRISLRSKTRDALNTAANRLRNQYKNNFPLNKDLKESAEKLWTDAHQVIMINDQPPTWIKIKPVSVFVMQPDFTADRMRAGLGLRIENQIVASDQKPELDIGQFPEALEIISEPTGENLSFSLPVALDFTSVNTSINQQINSEKPKIEKNIAGKKLTLNILGASITPSGKELIVQTDIKAKFGGFFGKRLSGKLYFNSIPILDKSSNKLLFSEFNYHADTQSTIANIAAYLLKPLVLSEIKEKLTIDLTQLETKAISKAKAEITKLEKEIPEGMALSLDPSQINLSDVIVSSNYLHLVLDVNGRIDIDVDDNFFIPSEG